CRPRNRPNRRDPPLTDPRHIPMQPRFQHHQITILCKHHRLHSFTVHSITSTSPGGHPSRPGHAPAPPLKPRILHCPLEQSSITQTASPVISPCAFSFLISVVYSPIT